MQRIAGRRTLASMASVLCSLFAVTAACHPVAAAEHVSQLTARDARGEAEQTITQDALKTYLSFIASDEMEGRDTPSRGLNTVAKFIATELSRWGFTPMGGDGTFFQKITLHSLYIDGPKSTMTIGGQPLRYGADFIPNGAGENGAVISAATQMVFVGEGWYVRAKGIDAYRGVDVRGKIVVIAAPTERPPGVATADLNRAGRGTSWMAPDAYAAQSGAVGIIRLSASSDSANWTQLSNSAANERSLGTQPVDRSVQNTLPTALPAVTLSPDESAALFRDEKMSLDAALNAAATDSQVPAFSLADSKDATIAIATHVESQTTQNIVAAWEGSDTNLKDQFVALGAHYDHLGIATVPSPTGDRIYNGADDDGSGTTALLTFAEALSHRPDRRPKRTLLFVWHCGEEKGLWGSSYFTNNPTVPIGQIVAQLNIDMIGRGRHPGDTNPLNSGLSDEKTIYVIGSRMLSHELGDIAEDVNRNYANLTFDYRFDDPNDPNRFYYRSDHYNYAKHNIPIIFFFDGVHEDYHRVTDKVTKIDFPKYETVARTIFLTVIAVADRDDRPVLDKK